MTALLRPSPFPIAFLSRLPFARFVLVPAASGRKSSSESASSFGETTLFPPSSSSSSSSSSSARSRRSSASFFLLRAAPSLSVTLVAEAGCGVGPREASLSPVAAPSALALDLLWSFTLILDFGASTTLADVDADAAAGFADGEAFCSAEGERERSLAGGLRSRVDARRADAGVDVEGSAPVLLDALLLGSGLTGVAASMGAVDVSATLLDARRVVVGGGEGALCAGPDCSGDTARGVAAGPGVGGAEMSERSESPSKASMVVYRGQRSCCCWTFQEGVTSGLDNGEDVRWLDVDAAPPEHGDEGEKVKTKGRQQGISRKHRVSSSRNLCNSSRSVRRAKRLSSKCGATPEGKTRQQTASSPMVPVFRTLNERC